MLKQTLATLFLTALLAGCSSTPDIHEEFTASEGDSYAKTTMRLMGTNKFVDSKNGDEGTRKVAGSGAMKVLQLVSLDFVGLAQNSLSDYLIEDDYTSKTSQLLVRLDGVSEAELNTPELLIDKARGKVEAMITNLGLPRIDPPSYVPERTRPVFYNFDLNVGVCKNVKGIGKCFFTIQHPEIESYDKATQSAYVRFNVYGQKFAAHVMGRYKSDDISLYITPNHSEYGSEFNYQTATKVPVVINSGRVHKFIKDAKFTDGAPIDDLAIYYQITTKETGIKKQYKINVADYTYTKIN